MPSIRFDGLIETLLPTMVRHVEDVLEEHTTFVEISMLPWISIGLSDLIARKRGDEVSQRGFRRPYR